MKKCILATLTVALICIASVAYADVAVQYDQISAYLDSTGGIVLTGTEDRLNTTDAVDLTAIDSSRVAFAVNAAAGDFYDIKTVDFKTGTEVALVNGVKFACSMGGSGIYYVPAEAPNTVLYISFTGAASGIYTSEEEIAYLQPSNHGLIIGLADYAGAMVYNEKMAEAVAFNGLTGAERVICGDSDIVLTDEGALYLDSPTLVTPALISGDVSEFAAIGNYIYYIYNRDGADMLMQYAIDTLTCKSIAMEAGRTPISVTASFTTALVMDDTGMVYSINGAAGTISQFANITPPEGYDVTDMFIYAVSGQMNVYAAQKEEKQDILVFDFAGDDDDELDAVEVQEQAKILLLASCPLASETNANTILFTEATNYATLSYGSRGDAVRKLQQSLTDLGYLNDRVDGIFGPRTRYAVRLFQDFNGLTANGIADTNMQKLLLGGNAPCMTNTAA